MKKLLLACATLFSVVSVSLGQGTANFANGTIPANFITTNTPSGSGPIQGLNQYRIGLYAGSQGTAASALTLVGLATNAPISAFAGQFNANPAGGFFQVPGFASGTTIAFQVRAWTLAAGLDYESALTAAGANPSYLVGASALGETTLGGGATPPGTLFGTNPGNVTGFAISPSIVPEPSSIALGLLGLGAIALFRRRK